MGFESRLSIVRSILRKSPVSKDVDLDYLAQATEKFTGADLTEICQRAAKEAIRESIARDVERIKMREEAGDGDDTAMEDDEDMVPEILPKHFEAAVRGARRSVSDRDLAQYSSFAQSLNQSRAQITSGGSSLGAFSFPTNNRASASTVGGGGGGAAAEEEEEDLYS